MTHGNVTVSWDRPLEISTPLLMPIVAIQFVVLLLVSRSVWVRFRAFQTLSCGLLIVLFSYRPGICARAD